MVELKNIKSEYPTFNLDTVGHKHEKRITKTLTSSRNDEASSLHTYKGPTYN